MSHITLLFLYLSCMQRHSFISALLYRLTWYVFTMKSSQTGVRVLQQPRCHWYSHTDILHPSLRGAASAGAVGDIYIAIEPLESNEMFWDSKPMYFMAWSTLCLLWHMWTRSLCLRSLCPPLKRWASPLGNEMPFQLVWPSYWSDGVNIGIVWAELD